jgi:galactokinase
MTGGGFGGCVIALVDTAVEEVVAAAVRDAVARVGYPDPTIVRTHAASGDAAE